jgi:purine-binding chemotaxis protein CheW
MVEIRQFCTFRLDRLYFGVETRDVQGVVSEQPLTRVPLAPPAVRGLMNLRGEVVASIDLRPCLGLDAGEGEHASIILTSSSQLVGLLVDEIGDVVAVAEQQLEPPPDALPTRLRGITESVCQQEGRLMLVLNVERTLHLASGMEAGI